MSGRLVCGLAAAILVPAFGVPAFAAQGEEPVESPSRLALVLDASRSMAEPAGGGGGSRIAQARQALSTVIGGLPDEQVVSLRIFGATAGLTESDPASCTDSERVVDADTDNRGELLAAVEDYEPAGFTPTAHALQEAASDLGDTGRRTIVLVSDGESNCDPDPCTVAETLSADGIDLVIDVVGLDVDGAAREQLRCVAERGNGTYVDATDAEEITEGLQEATVRSSRPFDLVGEAVTGTPSAAEAPSIGTGQYLDRFQGRDGQFYRLKRTAPGTTFHVGLTLIGEAGSPGSGGRVTISPIDPEDDGLGAQCASESAFAASLGERRPVFYAAVSSAAPVDSDCSTAEELVVTVAEARSNQVEEAPFELAIYEEPPLEEDPARPTADVPAEPVWEPLQPGEPDDSVVPGTSLSSAPLVEDGTYALDINANETQVLAVPVDWGQDVSAQVDADLTDAVMDATAIGSEFRVSFIGPLRDAASLPLAGAQAPDDWTSGALGNLREKQYRTGAQTPTVTYDHRTSSSGDVRGSSIAGIRYVAVNLAVRGEEANQPYTLTLRTSGTAGEGRPDYAAVDGLQEPEATSRLVTPPVPEEDLETAPAPDGGVPTWLVVVAAASVVALAATSLVVLRRRRG